MHFSKVFRRCRAKTGGGLGVHGATGNTHKGGCTFPHGDRCQHIVQYILKIFKSSTFGEYAVCLHQGIEMSSVP